MKIDKPIDVTWHSWTRDESARSIKQLRFNNANYFNSGAAVSIILISNWAILIFVHQHFHLTYSMLDMWANQHNEFKRLKKFFVKIALMLRKLFGPKVYFDWCSKKKKEISKKKGGKREGRSHMAPSDKKEWHSHIAPSDKKEWHSSFTPNFGSGAREWHSKECRSLTHCVKCF